MGGADLDCAERPAAMSGADLDAAVKRLQDCWESLSGEQASLRRANALLEQRVRDLELHLAEHFTREARPPVAAPRGSPSSILAWPALRNEKYRGQAGAACPGVAFDGSGAEGEKASGEEEVEEEEDGRLVEHCLGETLWDGAVFAGLPQLTRGGSAILLVSMLLNAAVQTYICAVLLSSKDFMQQRRYRDLERPMREFRLSYAHELKQVDAKGRSLASRVCGEDQSLFLAVTQANILGEINSYLHLKPLQLRLSGFGTGPLLCVVCIFLFAAHVLRELRSVAASTWAVCALPRGSCTALAGGSFSALSRSRLAFVLINNALRTGIAIMLLYTGIIWLSATSSITDLILNAAALCFVMDVDECLFQTTLPASVHMFVQGLQPLTYRRSRWSSEALLPLVAIFAVVVLCFPLLIRPNMNDMLAVKRALCDGNLDFAAKTTAVGLVVSNYTTPFAVGHGSSLLELAVGELVTSPAPDKAANQFSFFTKAGASFAEASQWTYPDFANTWDCIDQDVAYGGQLLGMYPGFFTAVRHLTGLHAGESLLERPFACSDYAASCQASNLLRTMCPVTCGCDDPTSGLAAAMPKHGCPSKCQPVRLQRLQNRPCVDMDVAGSARWKSYWTTLSALILESAINQSQRKEAEDVLARKVAQGCANRESVSVLGNMSDCDERAIVFAGNGLVPVSAFCAATCCRVSDPPAECPPSCSASAGGAAR